MTTLTEIWSNNKEFFRGKTIQQIIGVCGDGNLRDGSDTSVEFRRFLDNIPSFLLGNYASECLVTSFAGSGRALQDIINQIGKRLGFEIEYGLYQGRRGQIGFDGLWKEAGGYSLVIEAKTTDAYRINLNTLSRYRSELISSGRMEESQSSILIVVGRADTGDLEAQIRGSRHAWDIRLISTDSLVKLMLLREELDNVRTIEQINEILKPEEYTRIDRLIDVLFKSTKDAKTEEDVDVEQETSMEHASPDVSQPVRSRPVQFRSKCIHKIEQSLRQSLLQRTKSSFSSVDTSVAVVCVISKEYEEPRRTRFWFAFHPYYSDYLTKPKDGYMAFGCGSADLTLLIPFAEFKPLIDELQTTQKQDRMYWHVQIYKEGDSIYIHLPGSKTKKDLSPFLLNGS